LRAAEAGGKTGLLREARSELVYEVTKLSLWYTRVRASAGDDLADALTRRTPVCRLNDHPHFLAFFPSSWENGAEVSPVGYSYNWWGQFVNRTGGFHARSGRRFRETRTWPYRSLRRSCPIGELREEIDRRSVL
jgi:hypothetical protein